jgi:hypothetical protein
MENPRHFASLNNTNHRNHDGLSTPLPSPQRCYATDFIQAILVYSEKLHVSPLYMPHHPLFRRPC